MKKVLSIVLVLALIISFFTGFQSTAVKNYIPIDEETAQLNNGGYIPSLVEQFGMPAWGAWFGLPDHPTGDFIGDGIATIDKDVKKFGDQSLKLTFTGKKVGTGGAMIHMMANTLEAGKTYTFQAWVKTNKVMTPDGGAILGVDCLNTEMGKVANWYENPRSTTVTGTKDWTLLSVAFVCPEAEDAVLILSCMGAATMVSGEMWFDGLALVEGGDAVKEYDSLDKISGGGTTDPTKTPDPTKVPDPVVDEPSAWAKEEVAKAVEAKLVPEHINSKFTSNITRSDFCDLIINMITTKTGKAIADVISEYADKKDGITFPDTTSENVLAAAALGIVNGRSSGAFDPDASITRQEAAKMLTLAAKVLGADTTASDVEFADAADIFAWAKEFINYVNSIDVMKGTNTATPPNFSPTKNYTREQSILTVYRLFNAIGK